MVAFTILPIAVGEFAQTGGEETPSEIELLEGFTAIYNETDWNNITSNPSGNYQLMNDIDFTSVVQTSQGFLFTGILEGSGYNISIFDLDNSQIVGLFGLMEDSEVRNVNIKYLDKDYSINRYNAGHYMGGLSGVVINSSVYNVNVIHETETHYFGGHGGGNGKIIGGLFGVVAGEKQTIVRNVSIDFNDILAIGETALSNNLGGIFGNADERSLTTATKTVNISLDNVSVNVGLVATYGGGNTPSADSLFDTRDATSTNIEIKTLYYSGDNPTSIINDEIVRITENHESEESYPRLDFENVWFIENDSPKVTKNHQLGISVSSDTGEFQIMYLIPLIAIIGVAVLLVRTSRETL